MRTADTPSLGQIGRTTERRSQDVADACVRYDIVRDGCLRREFVAVPIGTQGLPDRRCEFHVDPHHLRCTGAVPDRPKFRTKAEATEAAKVPFERWLNRDSDEEEVAPKPDISVGQCFKNFLAMSLERAKNPDEKFNLGSQQNHIDNVIALNKLTINDQRLEKMMLRSVGKSVVSG